MFGCYHWLTVQKEITMEIIGKIGEQTIIRSDNCPDKIYLNDNIIDVSKR